MANPTNVTGKQTAPVAGTVIADTGVLSPGTYLVTVQCTSDDPAAVGKGMEIQHRNAANNANVDTWGFVPSPSQGTAQVFRVTLQDQERIRVVAGSVNATALSTYEAQIQALGL